MAGKGIVWECECGNIEYGAYPPAECSECEAVDSFIKGPDDEIEEREAENVLAKRTAEEEN